MSKEPLLVVIVGPTAVGKSAIAIKAAERFKTEIISCDSRQFYRELKIGTAKPNEQELKSVTHHFIDNKSIHEDYDAGSFAEDVNQLLNHLFIDHQLIIMVGGSGLYVNAVCDGLNDMPNIDQELRHELSVLWDEGNEEELISELKNSDPEYHASVDLNNKHRVLRALEIIRTTGEKYSQLRSKSVEKNKNYRTLKIGLDMDRSDLYQIIDQRMDHMIENGLFEEAKSLYQDRQLNALQTVGYREIFEHLDGTYDRNEAIRLLKRNSRRYAKRQLTWFRRDEEITWFHPSQIKDILNFIQDKLD